MSKVSRAESATKQRVRKLAPKRVKSHDQGLLEQAAREAAEGEPEPEAGITSVRGTIDYERTRRFSEALRGLLTGNLYTDGDGCAPAKALQRVATAQLRAVRAAMCSWTSEDCMIAPHITRAGERPGWEPSDTFTKNDAIEALGGTIALLHFGPDLLDEAEAILSTEVDQ